MLIEIVLALIAIWWLIKLWYKSQETPGVTGPSPLPILGNVLAIGKPDSSINWVRFRKQYGKIFRLWFGTQKIIVLCKPEHIKHTMVTNAKNYMSRRVMWSLASIRVDRDPSLVFNNIPGSDILGVLFSDGELHKLHRKVAIENMLRGEMLRKFGTSIVDYTDRLSARWNKLATEASGEVCLNVVPEFKNITMDIIGKAAFGFEFNSIESGTHELSTALLNLISVFDKRAVWFMLMDRFPILRRLPGSPAHETLKHAMTLKRWLRSVIEDKAKKLAKDEDAEIDFLDSLLHFRTADGRALTDAEILTDVLDMFVAGHETTATTLSWVVYFLGKHPEHVAKIREEVTRVLEGREQLAYDDVKSLEYTEAVIKETLRLSPIVPVVNRNAAEDDEIDGVKIKKQDTVVLNFISIMKDEDYWKNPDTFDPTRFLDANNTEANNRFTFVAFGVGPRTCVGIGLAMLEAKIILGMLVKRFNIRLHESNTEYVPQTRITTSPKGYSMKAYISKA